MLKKVYTDYQLMVFETFKDKTIDLKEVLQFFKVNIVQLIELPFVDVLPLLSAAVQYESTKTNCSEDIVVIINELLIAQQTNDDHLKFILQIIYQTLHTLDLNANQLQTFDIKALAETLIVIFNENSKRSHINNARIIACLKVCLNKSAQLKEILLEFWQTHFENCTKYNDELVAQIAIQLYDELLASGAKIGFAHEGWCSFVEQLLQLKERLLRKAAYYFLQKHLESTKQKPFWTAYINMWQSLDENQSHLVLPALMKLQQCIMPKSVQCRWRNILYAEILQQKNLLVSRLAIEYMLQSHCNSNLLQHLLNATNNTAHYNKQGYNMSDIQMRTFLLYFTETNDHWLQFLQVFVFINWKAVPLYCWLSVLPPAPTSLDCQKLILHLAARIRCLQQKELRKQCIAKFLTIFSKHIVHLLLYDYLNLVETMYNVNDNYTQSVNLQLLLHKLQEWQAAGYPSDVVFSERFYKILSANTTKLLQLMQTHLSEWLNCFRRFSTHGWFRYIFMFDLYSSKLNAQSLQMLQEFCNSAYQLNLEDIVNGAYSWNEVLQYFNLSLMDTEHKKDFIYTKVTDFFAEHCITNFDYFVENQKWELFQQLLENGSQRTLQRFCDLLLMYDKKDELIMETRLSILVQLFCALNKQNTVVEDDASRFIKCCLALSSEQAKVFTDNILDGNNYYASAGALQTNVKLDAKTYLTGILMHDMETGDARIESMYFENVNCLRKYYMQNLLQQPDEMLKNKVVKKLIKKNKELYQRKPRYFEHSAEHREQLLIAYSLARLLENNVIKQKYLQDIVNILRQQNNQLNVCYIYEYLAAQCLQSIEEVFQLFRAASRASASEQVSLISILHSFCFFKNKLQLTNEVVEKICMKLLLPLTMGANFQTRLYAMLVIHNLVQALSSQQSLSELLISLHNSIKTTMQGVNKIKAYLETDTRMLLPRLENCDALFCDIILYITNTTYLLVNTLTSEMQQQFMPFHNHFKNKIVKTTEESETAMEYHENIQRKMHPNDNALSEHGMRVFDMSKDDQQMIVVASLIDKLPNLGGIARTCEVLGIRNLIIKKMQLIEKPDFKNVSMTAEKTLNIFEVKIEDLAHFLMQKQTEGFEIVGAEQTANSKSFVNFTFPRKCILLLGHEKEGIPPTLLPYLNHTVEIPQFGHVRSLNVHITGALFMWEYCKQHICK